MLKRNTQPRPLAENARWDASDSWGDLHRTGASRLGVDQEIGQAIRSCRYGSMRRIR